MIFSERKGVGDIDLVKQKWKAIESVMEKNGKGAKEERMTESKYKMMWDELYEAALPIPNMSHPNAPKGDESQAKVGKG